VHAIFNQYNYMAKTSYMSRHLVYFFIKQVLGNDIE